MGFKARLWLSGSAVWWWGGRRKEWRRVVGAGWALGQAGRRIRVILHTSGAVDAGGCASVILIYVPRVTAAIVIEAAPIQAVQIRGRLWSRELLLSGKRAPFSSFPFLLSQDANLSPTILCSSQHCCATMRWGCLLRATFCHLASLSHISAAFY